MSTAILEASDFPFLSQFYPTPIVERPQQVRATLPETFEVQEQPEMQTPGNPRIIKSIKFHSYLGPQQGAVIPEASDFPFLSQFYPTPIVERPQQVRATLPETFEVQEQPEMQTPGNPSYAETTRLRVDEKARETLCSYPVKKLQKWTGKKLKIIMEGRQNNISVRDARIINSKAAAPVFQITAENVVEFTIDSIIRNRLKQITYKDVKTIVKPSEFRRISRINKSVMVEDAEKYNNYFQNPNLFDKERVFNLAYNEPIVEKTPEGTFIKITPDHRQKIKNLSTECKQQLSKSIGRNFRNIMYKTKSISEKNAILIHQISGKNIFDLNGKNAQKIPIHPATTTGIKRRLTVSTNDLDSAASSSKRRRTGPQALNVERDSPQKFSSAPGLIVAEEIGRSENSPSPRNPYQEFNEPIDFEFGNELYDFNQPSSVNSSFDEWDSLDT